MIQTIKDLKEAIADIPKDNIIYVKTIDGDIFDIRCIDDATSVGFWEIKLSNECTAYTTENDNVRRCNHCGKPMKEGYYWGGEYYCSKECLDATYTQEQQNSDMFLLKGDEKLSDLSEKEKEERFNENNECYYTEWESIYFD